MKLSKSAILMTIGVLCLGASSVMAIPANASEGDDYTTLVDGYRPADQSADPFAWAGKLVGPEYCSATLVGPHTIVTDAHCLENTSSGYTFYLQYNNGASPNYAGCTVKSNYYIPEQYPDDFSYDWAIANLDCNLNPKNGKYPSVKMTGSSFFTSNTQYINMGYPYVDTKVSQKWNEDRQSADEPLRSNTEISRLADGQLLQTCGYLKSDYTYQADQWVSHNSKGIKCRLGSGSSGGGWLSPDPNDDSGYALVGVNGFDNNDIPYYQFTNYWAANEFGAVLNSYLND
ncbi:trypsin-like serine peptidase [Psychromicrobium lacuslunae]|nr:trypsin-like serine protease [Psychromicrobium lacuslunae]